MAHPMIRHCFADLRIFLSLLVIAQACLIVTVLVININQPWSEDDDQQLKLSKLIIPASFLLLFAIFGLYRNDFLSICVFGIGELILSILVFLFQHLPYNLYVGIFLAIVTLLSYIYMGFLRYFGHSYSTVRCNYCTPLTESIF